MPNSPSDQTDQIAVDTDEPKLDNASQFTYMARSRVRKAFQKKSKRSIVVFLFGTILLISAVLFFGIPLLVNYTLLLDSTEEVQSVTDKAASIYVPSPSLNTSLLATNSASTEISGISERSYTIHILSNEKLINTVDVGNNGKFKTLISLTKGKNEITAVAVTKDKKKSDPSDPIHILYISEPPELDVSSPQNHQEFSGDQKRVEVTGTTSEGAKVTINGFWAVMSGDGSFRYSLPLQEGENSLTIISTDQATNTTETTLTVKYSQ